GTPIHGSVPSSFVTTMCFHLARRCIAREQAFPIHRRKHSTGAPYEQDALSVARTVPPAPRPVTRRATAVYHGPDDHTPPSVRSSPSSNCLTRREPRIDEWTEFLCRLSWQ